MADRDPYPSEKQDRFIVRLPDGMRDRIKASAEVNNRSMNAEIVKRLENSFDSSIGLNELDRVSHQLGRVSGTLEVAAEFFHDAVRIKLKEAAAILSDIDIETFVASLRKHPVVQDELKKLGHGNEKI